MNQAALRIGKPDSRCRRFSVLQDSRQGENLHVKAKALYQEGKLQEAIQSLSADLRDKPTDAKSRTFLFELLCFAGEYERADKHLNLLADVSGEAKMGAVLYMSALHGS